MIPGRFDPLSPTSGYMTTVALAPLNLGLRYQVMGWSPTTQAHHANIRGFQFSNAARGLCPSPRGSPALALENARISLTQIEGEPLGFSPVS
jgi:hypothetical protein